MKPVKCMKDLPIFSTLSPEERNKIGELAVKKVYRKNEFIFQEGDPADTIFIIKYGRVRLYKISPGGKEITLEILKEDNIFGENTFFDDSLHTMNAQTLEDTFLCSCSREDFLLLLQNPRVSLKIIQVLGTKLNSYTDQVASIAFRDVRGRISAALLRLSQEYGESSPEGTTTININLTHQDLANLVNASRVMVTNVLINLRQEGTISTEDHRFTLLDHEKLKKAVEAV